jgi:hypothetical protein
MTRVPFFGWAECVMADGAEGGERPFQDLLPVGHEEAAGSLEEMSFGP